TVAGILLLADTTRRRRRKAIIIRRQDFGAFLERFDLIPFPQPPTPPAKLPLQGLTFAIKDIFDVKGYVTGFGNPDWRRTHEPSDKMALVLTALLQNGAKCVGKTVMDELAFGITGENKHYGTPINPKVQSNIPGGSSSGSAVAVAAEFVDFALGTDTIGGIRLPASFCGILGFRPSHQAVSTIGLIPNSQSLDTIEFALPSSRFPLLLLISSNVDFKGWFARDPSVLHRVGHVLLKVKAVEPKRERRLVFADDLFQLSKVTKQKTVYVVSKAIEKLSGYQPPQHINFSQYVASNVPSLKAFGQNSSNLQYGISALKALSSVMVSLQSYEFKTNHEEWVKNVKPRLGPEISHRVLAAINTKYENVKVLYKVGTEMRAALQSLLKVWLLLLLPLFFLLPFVSTNVISFCTIFYLSTKVPTSAEYRVILMDPKITRSSFLFQDDGILVIPTIVDPPPKLNSMKDYSTEFHDRACAVLSIASMSGGCQACVPLGNDAGCPVSVSFVSYHGADKFLLDAVLDMYASLQDQVSIAFKSALLPDVNGNMDASQW
ncbi:hypothetical protein Golax_004774, partial [Gossypium laxum]|nr:hypothetical protein [Gossypium laxum]